jgi:hypothetical protein
MAVNNPQELGELLEKIYKKPLWRHCNVRPAGHPKNKRAGVKDYLFEYPKRTSADIKKEGRGYTTSRTALAEGWEPNIYPYQECP